VSIKLLVADDHEVVRSGLASLLSGSDIKIVAEASTANEAVKMANKHKPDVVLLDIRMGETDGLEALEKIHRDLPKTHVVILSTYDNPTYVARAVALGASDYVLKGASRQELVSTIRGAAKGDSPTTSGEMHRVAGAMNKSDAHWKSVSRPSKSTYRTSCARFKSPTARRPQSGPCARDWSTDARKLKPERPPCPRQSWACSFTALADVPAHKQPAGPPC